MSVLKYDLHIHSDYSDGVLSVQQIIDKSIKKKLCGISITDHDTIEAYRNKENLQYDKNSFELITGVEISCFYDNLEVHLVGLYIDPHNKKLSEYCEVSKKDRANRAYRIIEALNEDKINITFDNVLAESRNKPILRPHIALALIKKNYAKNYYEAFAKYLNDNSKYVAKKNLIHISEAANIIKEAEGLSFIAHPYNLNIEILSRLYEYAIDGIEIANPKIRSSKKKELIKFAEEKKILMAGGSDYHGLFSADNKNFGNYYITEKELNEIKKRRRTNENNRRISEREKLQVRYSSF
jgi:hypothetical protein